MLIRRGLKDYFSTTGFIDLLPLALKLADKKGYGKNEIIEAICKVADGFMAVLYAAIYFSATFILFYDEKLIRFPKRLIKLIYANAVQLGELISCYSYIAEIRGTPEVTSFFEELDGVKTILSSMVPGLGDGV